MVNIDKHHGRIKCQLILGTELMIQQSCHSKQCLAHFNIGGIYREEGKKGGEKKKKNNKNKR